MLQTYAGELQMTRVEIWINTSVNGVSWTTFLHHYIYEKYCTTTILKEILNRLRKSKYEYVGYKYDKDKDTYILLFRLDVIL